MQTLNQLKGNLQRSIYDYLNDFFPEEQNKISEEDAENALIYGIECYQIKFSKFYNSEICLSYIDSNVLDFYNKDKERIKKVNFEKIDNINFRHLDKIGQSYNFDLRYNYLCQVLVKRNEFQLFFKEKQTALLFVKGLLVLARKNYINSNNQVDVYLERFNTNFNDTLEDEELEYLASQLDLDLILLKSQIDKDKNNTVTLKEFKDYLRENISGEQFRPIFEKYSTLILNDKERVMGPIDLQNFYKECQQEEISYLEACQIIIEFNSYQDNTKKLECIQSFEDLYLSNKSFNENDISSILIKHNQTSDNTDKDKSEPFRLFMNLYEFNMMLHSLLLTVYNTKKLNQKLDIDHPLTDYFISSSHNTYLTGHQIIGKSSTKMYSTSLLYNFRMLELDCYEGEQNEIIITHGYTLVDDLYLNDVLVELKDTAFINSDLPVILSIENHLGEKYQNIMVEKIKKILKDLYIFPADIKPEHLPSLRDLKKRFLIKCGGKKLWENETITPKDHIKQVYNLNNDLSNSFLLNQKINPSSELIDKKIIFLTKKTGQKQRHTNTIIPKIKRTKNISVNLKKDIVKSSVGLEKILGLIGVKFNKEKIDSNYYKPWEMMTLKCSKATKFSEDFIYRKKITNLTKHCLLRIYPENFDSTNYNIIKCFACGIQGCCLNIQSTKDDFTLYNKIFFKQNEGLGYVLKPERFLSNEFNCYYDRASHIFKIQILSLINIYKLIEESKKDFNVSDNSLVNFLKKGFSSDNNPLNISIYAIGIKEDENNPKYNFQLINGSLFPKFKNGVPNVEFKVYDYELSAVIIKIKYEDKVIGRCCIPYSFIKQGYRRIPVYDNQCFNMKDVYMVAHFSIYKI